MIPREQLMNDVLATISVFICEVIGDDVTSVSDITLSTSFNRDLELESIEFVVLSEKIQQKYGEKVNFVSWLATKQIDYLISLTVGDLVEFIVGSLTDVNN